MDRIEIRWTGPDSRVKMSYLDVVLNPAIGLIVYDYLVDEMYRLLHRTELDPN